MRKKHVFVLYERSISLSLFKNLFDSGSASVLIIKRNWFGRFLRRFFKTYIELSAIRKIRNAHYRECILWFDNESVSYIKKPIIDRLRKENKVNLFFIDEVSNEYPSIKNAKELVRKKAFDAVYTYSTYDAALYGFLHSFSYYSKICNDCHPTVEYDTFFIGNVKGRASIISSFLRASSFEGVKNHFMLAGDTQGLGDTGFQKIKYVPYVDSVKEMLKSNCIIDFVDGENKGQSLRYFEAVVYNKKLLTNNPFVKNLPFFNPRYMRVISGLLTKDDLEWMKTVEDVDYKYDGRFEPINLLRMDERS